MTLYLIVPDVEGDKWKGTPVDGHLQAVLTLRRFGAGSIAYTMDKRDWENVVVADYCDGNGEIVWKP